MSLATRATTVVADGETVVSGGLLHALLAEQQLPAVEKFSQWHARESAPAQARYYRDLIPVALPRDGEQLAFEVDLDACSGCKACVTACHNLNGLEEEELWRSVGLLHGGTGQQPVLQHVTTACHHCLEPACLAGCPVEAYQKDPVTGIVRHLDDQCIGCQYCILTCPYDVPKYSRAKGIVRKCDMCSGRLAVGEAPACVQACPNKAIRITVVNKEEVAENAEANLFLPGAPEPGTTLPTTVYKTRKALPANLLPADYFSSSAQHAHWSLVVMLLLTQMSVGALVVDQLLGHFALGSESAGTPRAGSVHLWAALILGMIGMAAAVFHLGRPWLAYRALIGWRTSWLSREVIAFGCFALLAAAYAAQPWLHGADAIAQRWIDATLGAAAALGGLAGVVCSVMIYGSTRRVFWHPAYTGIKFLLTCVVLGIPAALLIQLVAAWWSMSATFGEAITTYGPPLFVCLAAAGALKLSAEAAVFCWLGARTFTPMRRTALLMTGELRRITVARFLLGIAGGIALPAWLFFAFGSSAAEAPHPAVATFLVLLLFFVCAGGELLERYLFFAAVVAPKMPGATAT